MSPALPLSEPVAAIVRGTSNASALALGPTTVHLCPTEIARALNMPVADVIRDVLALGSAEVHVGGGVLVSWDADEALLVVTKNPKH